ncbi:hypothetical protein OKW21_001511 [Catalinimonas alkaloidigena]|uniref:fibronectin type III domain-containing protein n=1 Tax=Catalinimonas alkaloidigena TaxID=1075417 RepID=UPI002406A769|nr:fibronectin type III domain-containing protein [Catalinimonas alkaloidigena]MDF9796248.1 hypothetical protein [Catalinimonas alkaloidigena]
MIRLVYLINFLMFFTVNCKGQIHEKRSSSSLETAHQKEAEEVLEAFSQLTVDTPPDTVYKVFNQFCLNYYGAKTDSLYHTTFGHRLKISEESRWNYISERSATIAWETNLPTKTYVEYGKTKDYRQRTPIPERYFFIHVHYLKNLSPNTQYHYRLVSIDEEGSRIESTDQIFYTQEIIDAIEVPGTLGKPPYVLDQANTTYLVTEDITADKSAFDIQAGGITLDLGGHTITHANQLIDDLDYENINKSGVGIRRVNNDQQSGLKIFNGIIKQGKARNNQDYVAGENMLNPDPEKAKLLERNSKRGFSNIEITGKDDVEIAGVTVEYHLPQSWGMRFDDAFGEYDIHHNVFLDKGTQMFNRHGLGGARSLGFKGYDKGKLDQNGNDLQVHHNLIKRTRQNTINAAQEIFHNEIYVDSWVVNSFAIQPSKEQGHVYGNKIFLTGYYSCGILWASKDLNVNGNFIHMEGVRTMIETPNKGMRLIETWGEQDVLAGMRVTNYGEGGQARENLHYENNVIFGRSRQGGEMRGTEFFSDYSIKNLVFKGNIVKVLATDSMSTIAACIDTQGAYNDRSTHLPLFYKSNKLISNICNIRFGDAYGQGSNHHFVNCKLIKAGNHPEYHTFVFDGHNSVFNHVLLDCEFGEGTSYDDVYWKDTGSLSNYQIQWTLTIDTHPGAEVKINDRFGNLSYAGIADAEGKLSTPLAQCTIRPMEWTEQGVEVIVEKKYEHQADEFSPYNISVRIGNKEKTETVDMNGKKTVRIQF